MKNEYRFLLKQGIGKAATPIVKKGDRVKRGQLIADYDPNALSVPLHSSVTGQVTKIDETAIFIQKEADGSDYLKLPDGMSTVETVRKAGIIGMGGAGFPTYVKLQSDLQGSGYLLCNAAECEPILAHNMHQIDLYPDKLIEGIKIAMDATKALKAFICIKLLHKETILKLSRLLQHEPQIKIYPLKNRYPMGEERAVIRESLNTLLGAEDLPIKANAVVLNVETLMAVYDAVVLKKPLIDKYMTIAGKINNLGNNRVLCTELAIGRYIQDVIDENGGLAGKIGEVIIGGPYTGHRLEPGEVVTKVSGGIIATEEFAKINDKIGVIQCACGPKEDRIRELCQSYGAEIVGYTVCKNAVEVKPGLYKCKDPGNCPGQAEKVLQLRKDGAKEVFIGHCSDCTNTVMQVAPKLKMPVHHASDHALQTLGMEKIRFLRD